MWWMWLWLGMARAELFDRVVAQVDQQLVLASDVALDQALAAHDPVTLPYWSRPVGAIQRQVHGAAIRVAAGDIALYQPSPDEISARVEAIRASFPDRAAWSDFLRVHGLDDSGLRTVVKRRLVVERFLRRNILTDPDDPDAWFGTLDELMAGILPRVRVRMIPTERR